MIAYPSLGSWIKVQRKSLDLTQEHLAEQIGYALSTVRKIEGGVLRPSREIAERLADCLAIADDERGVFIRLARAPLAVAPSVAESVPTTTLHRPTIPALATPLLGRAADVAAVCERITAPDVRLLTLCGPPGIGKTSLALAVATTLRGHFHDHVYFVGLAAITDPKLVALAIANTLGFADSNESAAETLKQRLHGPATLLVLDNFEHVLAAAPLLADLLSHCPALRIIVTSRSVLHLRGEHQYPVPSLAVPDLSFEATWEAFGDYAAVALFVRCAKAVLPDWTLNAQNAAAVGIICARLDGLPLAIELIATRVKVMSPQTLVARLNNRLALLSSNDADRPARHQTLRAAIDWSYSLMPPAEGQLFAQLGAFVGGCTLEAVEASCVIASLDVVDGIAALLDRSMVRHSLTPNGEPRFTMLEMVREYALECLAASGNEALTRQRIAAYYAALVQTAAAHFHDAEQSTWFDRLEREHDNLRATLTWYISHDPTAGLQLAALLRDFWHARGHMSEGRTWLTTLLALADSASLTRAQALATAGFLACHQGDYAATIVYAEAALLLGRQHHDPRSTAAALYNLGSATLLQNEYDRSLVYYAESLALYSSLGDIAEAAQVLKNQGLVVKEQGDYERATTLIAESLRLRRSCGDARGIANSLLNLSIVVYWLGEYARTVTLAEEAHVLYHNMGDHLGRAYILNISGMALSKQNQHAEGAVLLAESLELFREMGDSSGVALVLNDLGLVVAALGDSERASRMQHESLALAWRMGEKRRAAFALEGWAAAVAHTQSAWAAQLCGAAHMLRETIGAPIPPAERAAHADLLATIRAQLAPAEWQQMWDLGQTCPIEAIIAEQACVA